jgi:thiol:disulfide interchange protein DsbC
MKVLVLLLAVAVSVGFACSSSFGFGDMQGSCESDCQRCHTLSVDEATSVVKEINPEIEVVSVKLSPVGGLWEVVVKARGKRSLAYVDFSKQFLVTGDIIKVSTKKNVTDERLYELSRIDVTSIPLDEALLMGKADARFKVIVFDDPD